ncbi:MAG: hypothetical protein PHP63_04600 [Candidatus Marinimicrobia bacterium]|nr:hypothetical protein [Candidatus Neomarinimicrobiota bacterium]
MRIIIIIVILILFSVTAYSIDLYPYYLRFAPNNGNGFIYRDSCYTVENLENWKTYYTLFYEFWYSPFLFPIQIDYELLDNPLMPQLSDIPREQAKYAADDALEKWNEVFDNLDIFQEFDSTITVRLQS